MLQLNELDRERLDGRHGKAMQFAMQTVVAAARIDRAERLIDIGFAHIDACFYSGRAHLDFVNYLLDNDARLAVPTWTNNGLVSLCEPGLRDAVLDPAMLEARQLMEAYERLGSPDQRLCNLGDLQDDQAPYFALVLAHRGRA